MAGPELIPKYFPELTAGQHSLLKQFAQVFPAWNDRVNLISRKDVENIVERHILHSLGIAKVQPFKAGQQVIDIGTGGGFPGIPLAILYPKVQFHLIDSTGKKIVVVNELISELHLKNVTAEKVRSVDHELDYHFIVSRAVSKLDQFYSDTAHLLLPGGKMLCLKGGDLADEIAELDQPVKVHDLSDHFEEEFFETKRVVAITP